MYHLRQATTLYRAFHTNVIMVFAILLNVKSFVWFSVLPKVLFGNLFCLFHNSWSSGIAY
jgi:hypothetical protein